MRILCDFAGAFPCNYKACLFIDRSDFVPFRVALGQALVNAGEYAFQREIV